jgi:hypothetical protein
MNEKGLSIYQKTPKICEENTPVMIQVRFQSVDSGARVLPQQGYSDKFVPEVYRPVWAPPVNVSYVPKSSSFPHISSGMHAVKLGRQRAISGG